jgi:hypothetical protein
MAKKDKPKKLNPKKEKYAKFHREKPDAMDFSSPEFDEVEVKQQRSDLEKFDKFLRFRGRTPKEINEKKKRRNIK